jgi:hypothetical protein
MFQMKLKLQARVARHRYEGEGETDRGSNSGGGSGRGGRRGKEMDSKRLAETRELIILDPSSGDERMIDGVSCRDHISLHTWVNLPVLTWHVKFMGSETGGMT